METSKWPATLDACVVSDWLAPGECLDDDDDLLMYHCWFRWCEARIEYLRGFGWRADDAQDEGVGPFPALSEEKIRANEALISKCKRLR